MNIKRAEQLIKFVKRLNREEFGFVRSVVSDESQEQFLSKIKRIAEKKPYKKRKQKHLNYSDKQIKKAYTLKKQGMTYGQIAKETEIKVGTLRNVKWLEDRYKTLRSKK